MTDSAFYLSGKPCAAQLSCGLIGLVRQCLFTASDKQVARYKSVMQRYYQTKGVKRSVPIRRFLFLVQITACHAVEVLRLVYDFRSLTLEKLIQIIPDFIRALRIFTVIQNRSIAFYRYAFTLKYRCFRLRCIWSVSEQNFGFCSFIYNYPPFSFLSLGDLGQIVLGHGDTVVSETLADLFCCVFHTFAVKAFLEFLRVTIAQPVERNFYRFAFFYPAQPQRLCLYP